MEFRDKCILLRYLFDMRRRIMTRDPIGISDGERTLCSLLDQYVNSLSTEAKVVITNDFIAGKPHNWWTDFYSKSTYYRIKKAAMDELLNNLKW